MKSKTLLWLLVVCAACVQAATYTSDYSGFDAGHGHGQAGELAHAGVFGSWISQPLHSADYTIQAGPPPVPSTDSLPGTPLLEIVLIGKDVRISWPASATGFELEETLALHDGSPWTPVPGPYQESNGERFVLVPAAQGSRFYRLHSQ